MFFILGNGCVIHPQQLFKEIEKNADGLDGWENRLLISNRAHIGISSTFPDLYSLECSCRLLLNVKDSTHLMDNTLIKGKINKKKNSTKITSIKGKIN